MYEINDSKLEQMIQCYSPSLLFYQHCQTRLSSEAGKKTRWIGRRLCFYSRFSADFAVDPLAMKVKVISRNPDEYLRETKRDIHKGE